MGLAISPDRLAPLTERGLARVLTIETLGRAPTVEDGELVLVVTDGSPDSTRAARSAFTTPSVLALVEEPSRAKIAVEAGADHVLPADASADLIIAVYLAAERAVSNRIRRRELDFRRMVEIASDAIVIVDLDSSKILEVNTAAVAMFGYSPAEFCRLTAHDLAGADAVAVVERLAQSLILTGKALEHRHPMRRRDGTKFFATVQLTAYDSMGRRQYLGVLRDITEQVAREQELERSNKQLAEAQTQLLHSRRLAALGQMAAGVAHEINNPLQYLLSGIEELSEVASLDREKHQTLADMLEGANRIRSITRSLLPFARVDATQLEHVDINEVVAWAARVNANEIRHRAQLDLRLGPVSRVVAQRVRLGQLVTNLLSNAAHAITEGASERHRITVTTEMVDQRVRLTVDDTGSGIAEEIRSRVFDPFFTTKPREVGTGLGLALCAEIVTRQGGTIDFESKVGAGTRFVVSFGPGDGDLKTPPPRVDSPVPTRAPRVLLIDDEELIIRTYRRFLKDLDVVTATGGTAALGELAKSVDFDVVICDLMMPNVDGPMIYAHIRNVAPELVDRILFCTGGAFTPRVRDFLEHVSNVVLDKPVTPRALRASIEEMLARRP